MKTFNAIVAGVVLAFSANAADPLTEKLQRGLFEEEANRNLDAAIKEYQSVVTHSDEQRKVIATALFRLGECYRKLDRTNEAQAYYQRILRDFSDQEQLVKLSRELLPAPAASGPVATATDPAVIRLLRDEIGLAEQAVRGAEARAKAGRGRSSEVLDARKVVLQLQRQLPENASPARQRALIEEQIVILKQRLSELERMIQAGRAPTEERFPIQRELLALQRELSTVGLVANAADSTTTLTQAEAEELARVKALAQNSPDLLSAPYKDQLTPLQFAAREGFPAVVEFILAQGVSVNGPERGTPPLVLAAERGHLRIVEMLLNRGADINAVAEHGDAVFIGKTALIAAVEQGFKGVVDLLLARRADVNRETRQGATALHYAVLGGDSNLVAAILARKPQLNGLVFRTDYYKRRQFPAGANSGFTPLHLAAALGYEHIAQQLLAAGAPVNQTNRIGQAPLHVAVWSGHTPIVPQLLKNGADAGLRAQGGETPLGLAVQNDADVTLALLTGGAKVNEPAYQRPVFMTFPLHLAGGGTNAEILRVLLAAKPELEVTNHQGLTPLWSALANNQETNLAMLIEAGANVHRRWGKTAPIQSAVNKTERAVELLLKAGADANLVNEETGDTLLHIASRNRRAAVVRVLLEHGANPNVFNGKLETPFSIADDSAEGRGSIPVTESQKQVYRREWREVAQLLAQNGADIFAKRRLQIGVRRSATDFPIFTRGTNTLNRFTLMEVIGAVYQYGSAGHPGMNLKWPDFSRLRIHRVTGSNEVQVGVDLRAAMESQNCTANEWLEWGDIVEIPESIHPLNEGWQALTASEAGTIENCVRRSVHFYVGRTNLPVALTTPIRVKNQGTWAGNAFHFAYLPIVLRNQPVVNSRLRASSDLSRVTVRRKDPGSGQVRTMTFNVTDIAIPNTTTGRVPIDHTLWLRDGDVIEIPEKE